MDYSKYGMVKTKEEEKKMGFFDKLFGTEKTQTSSISEEVKLDTKFLLDIGIKMISSDSEGGFVKIFFETKGSELQMHFCETYILKDSKLYTSMGKYLSLRFPITGEEGEKFVSMTKINVLQKYSYADWMSFNYYYPSNVSKNELKKWVESYLRENYSKYKMECSGNTLVLNLY